MPYTSCTIFTIMPLSITCADFIDNFLDALYNYYYFINTKSAITAYKMLMIYISHINFTIWFMNYFDIISLDFKIPLYAD